MARYRKHKRRHNHSRSYCCDVWSKPKRHRRSYKKINLFKVSKPRRSYSTTYVSPTNVNTTANNTNNAKQTEDTMLMVGLSIMFMFIICVVVWRVYK